MGLQQGLPGTSAAVTEGTKAGTSGAVTEGSDTDLATQRVKC